LTLGQRPDERGARVLAPSSLGVADDFARSGEKIVPTLRAIGLHSRRASRDALPVKDEPAFLKTSNSAAAAARQARAFSDEVDPVRRQTPIQWHRKMLLRSARVHAQTAGRAAKALASSRQSKLPHARILNSTSWNNNSYSQLPGIGAIKMIKLKYMLQS
jgi:hypothetical protein